MTDPILWYVIGCYVVTLIPCGYWLYEEDYGGKHQAALMPICVYFLAPLVLPPAMLVVVIVAPLIFVGMFFSWYCARGEK